MNAVLYWFEMNSLNASCMFVLCLRGIAHMRTDATIKQMKREVKAENKLK